jgi:hypothetical protein
MDSKPISSTNPVGGRGAPPPREVPRAPHVHAKADSAMPQAVDLFRFAPSRAVILRLLRERVLARTRSLLGLPLPAQPAHFADASELAVADFVGRVWAEQTQMAALRLHVHPDGQERRTLAEAFELGANETLEMLQDAGRLDAASEDLIAQVLAAFARMVEPDGGGGRAG